MQKPKSFTKHTQLRAFALAGAYASDAVSGHCLPARMPLTRYHIGEVFLSGLEHSLPLHAPFALSRMSQFLKSRISQVPPPL